MAEQAAMPKRSRCASIQCYRLPFDVICRRRIAEPDYDTAWFALRERARLESGETVLVLGASGGVGQAAIQLARAMGARVLAGILRPERAASVRAPGPTR
jgi:NADPH2:quinone reductase